MKPRAKTEFALFNVTYEDGAQTSNPKLPVHEIYGLEVDQCIQAVIEAQDAEFAARSGKQRGPIKSIEKVKARKTR